MALGLISLIDFGADGGVFACGAGTTPLDEATDPAISESTPSMPAYGCPREGLRKFHLGLYTPSPSVLNPPKP